MGKIAFIADLHTGNHRVLGGATNLGMNERCWLTVQVLSIAVQTAKEQGCTTLVIAGDIFDTTKPTPQMIAAVQEAVTSDIEILILLGNHDQQSGDLGDHALGPLHMWSTCEVIDTPTYSVSGNTLINLVPFQPGNASLWLPGEIGSLADKWQEDALSCTHRILCLHLGLKSGNEPQFLANAHDAIGAKPLAAVCRQFGIENVIAGNWHFKNVWKEKGVLMYQCGTICPTGFDNPGFEGHGNMAIFDDGRWESVEIPGPRFYTAKSWEDGEKFLGKVSKYRKMGHTPFLRWYVAKEELAAARELVLNHGLGAEVLPDGKEAQISARRASSAARKAETTTEAIHGFVKGMELPDGVRPERVIERVRRYLKA